MSALSSITRAEILKFPFPYKLWIVVNLQLDFLEWNRDGTVILLDLVALEEYLNSSTSIFSAKNRSEFLTQLHEFKFERLNATPEDDEDVLLQYKNENFQRYRLHLLAKIRRNTYRLMDGVTVSIANHQRNEMKAKSISVVSTNRRNATRYTKVANRLAMERMKGDLCFVSHGALSDVQFSRFRFQTILNFQYETRVLKQKMRMLDEKYRNQRQFGAVNDEATIGGGMNAEQLPEFSADLYENPHDSAMTFNEHTRHEYAGYYGNCGKEHLHNFFGDYLPQYEKGTMEIKRISSDLIMSRNAEALRNLESKNQEANRMTKPLETFAMSTPKSNLSILDSDLHFSSSLEPIYCNEDEENDDIEFQAKANNPESDAEMTNALQMNIYNSMIREQPDISLSPTHTEEMVSGYRQMPSAIKVEVSETGENKENDANFRNFFSQYRSSLNLIYERN